MKKVFLVVLFLLLFSSSIAYADESPVIIINGKQLVASSPPIIENGRTLVPLRMVFETLKQPVVWNDQDQSIKSGNIWLQINNQIAKVGDKQIILEAPARIINNRTYVPLRFIAEGLGADVTWDPNTNNVDVRYQLRYTRADNGYTSVVKINGKIYRFEYTPFIVCLDNEKEYYIRFDKTELNLFLSVAYSDYVIKSSSNPFIDGYLESKSPYNINFETGFRESKYIESKVKFLSIDESYDEYIIYNSNKSKSYKIVIKPKEEKGVIFTGDYYRPSGEYYIPITDLENSLGDFKFNIELDHKNKLAIFNFIK